MSDSLPPPPPVGEPITYRPLSGFAIAGFAAACLFALLMLVVVLVALVQRAPFFYSPWVLLVPAAGLVLSLIARGQIRGSEGTRAGDALARAGIWLSLLTGLGYFVYYTVTGLAVTSQANAFLMDLGPDSGFFAHLVKAAANPADLNAAFLLSLPPNSRPSVRPEDEATMTTMFDKSKEDGSAGPLTAFRGQRLVRLFLTGAADQLQVEPQGVHAWDYENRSYRVLRNYRITTPEAIVEYAVVVRSSEGESVGAPRRWFVDLKQLPPPIIQRTALGQGLQALRRHALTALFNWKADLDTGKSFDFAKVDETRWSRLGLSEVQHRYVRERLNDLFGGTEPRRLLNLVIPPDDDALGDWQRSADGRLRLWYPFRLRFDPRGDKAAYTVEGYLVVETTAAVDPQALDPNTEPAWAVRSISVTRAAPMTLKKGGPGG